jgi:hypothetical protein
LPTTRPIDAADAVRSDQFDIVDLELGFIVGGVAQLQLRADHRRARHDGHIHGVGRGIRDPAGVAAVRQAQAHVRADRAFLVDFDVRIDQRLAGARGTAFQHDRAIRCGHVGLADRAKHVAGGAGASVRGLRNQLVAIRLAVDAAAERVPAMRGIGIDDRSGIAEDQGAGSGLHDRTVITRVGVETQHVRVRRHGASSSC